VCSPRKTRRGPPVRLWSDSKASFEHDEKHPSQLRYDDLVGGTRKRLSNMVASFVLSSARSRGRAV